MTKYQHKIDQTDQKIENSLLFLMKEIPFAKISINQICERAEINRSTFYRHFADKYLVLEKIENGLINEFFSISNQKVEKSFLLEDLAKNLEDYVDELLDVILENQPTLAIILGENGNPNFYTQLTEMLLSKIKNTWQKISQNGSGNLNHLDTDLAINFIVSADMAIIRHAVEHPEIPNQLIKNTFSQLLINGPLKTIYKSLIKNNH
ncbi:TetR/AcrR family transcriptional regulator [Fructilactobacillus frigidiflavus]|uniref:TetR/AcrR family transcriptional regulator n=1 Tax=Fructilactobacillus frigidiflavus TaxID=3242688 RepID=UPI0037565BEE